MSVKCWGYWTYKFRRNDRYECTFVKVSWFLSHCQQLWPFKLTSRRTRINRPIHHGMNFAELACMRSKINDSIRYKYLCSCMNMQKNIFLFTLFLLIALNRPFNDHIRWRNVQKMLFNPIMTQNTQKLLFIQSK